MHWCAEETMLVLGALPVIGLMFHKLKNWWHLKFNHKNSKCSSEHHRCFK